MEIWKPVVGYEGYYEISNLGRVKSNRAYRSAPGRIMKQTIDHGYCAVSLRIHGGYRKERVHRLMMKAFVLNPENKSDVNHKNGIKNDNRFENLEWATRSENISHAYRTGLKFNTKNHPWYTKGGGQYRAIRISQYSIDGNFIKEWCSGAEVERELGISRSRISRCCLGRKGINTAGGFVWKHLTK